MQFNSYEFILAFLPAILILYFLGTKINFRIGKFILIAGSIIFYTNMNFSLLTVLLISIAINFLFAKLIEKKWNKLFLAVPVITNVGLLLYYKYTNFAIESINQMRKTEIPLQEIILPLGISFFTFQQIAYIVSVYRKELEKADFVDYLTYILYFPKLLMGPLADPVDFIGQINQADRKKVNWDNMAHGIKMFCFGLAKKVVLADTFALMVAYGFENVEATTSTEWFLIMILYSFEIYFDFSGYSDMAVGTSLMLNIDLPMNFDSPYKAVSIRDFWKRWHISLTKFLTKYIYIPLGGNRRGMLFTCVNMFLVFLISGIWHGANWTFILWGIAHGLLCVTERLFEKYQNKIFEPLRWVVTFFIVSVLWLLFRAESVEQWYAILHKMITAHYPGISDAFHGTLDFPEASILCYLFPIVRQMTFSIRGFWTTCFLVIASLICFVPENNYRTLKNKHSFVAMIVAALALVYSLSKLGGESVFVYFNF